MPQGQTFPVIVTFLALIVRMRKKNTVDSCYADLFEEDPEPDVHVVHNEVGEVADVHEGPAQQQPRHPTHLRDHPQYDPHHSTEN
jgi:hypothetical protein